MKKMNTILVCVLCLFAFGCTYQTPILPVYEVDTYSSYADKIEGKYLLFIDTSSSVLNPQVAPSSGNLGADARFAVEFTESFRTSVKNAVDEIFENAVEVYNNPLMEARGNSEVSGYIIISAKHYEPSLQLSSGMVRASVTSSVNMGIDYRIFDSAKHQVLSGLISNSRTATIDGGAFGTTYNDSIKVIQQATQKALRGDLEEFIQQVVNSQVLRNKK